jgi:hypothetical protein
LPQTESGGELAELTDDQRCFVAFLVDLTDKELLSTYRSYQVLAEFGPIHDAWKRNACLSSIQRRLGSDAARKAAAISERGKTASQLRYTVQNEGT